MAMDDKQKLVNFSSPLEVINQKELELRHTIEKVQQQADALLRAAREEAKQSLAQAEQAAQAEADMLYQCGLDEARQQAAMLLETADEEAAALRRQTTTRLGAAVRQIVAWVLAQSVDKVDWNFQTSNVLMNRE
jgi:vacuolar-type H+-ATPase subunit H